MVKFFRRLGNVFFILAGIYIALLAICFAVKSYQWDHNKNPAYYDY